MKTAASKYILRSRSFSDRQSLIEREKEGPSMATETIEIDTQIDGWMGTEAVALAKISGVSLCGGHLKC